MEKFQDIIEKIEKLSVLELNELVKALEEKFGVSAVAAVAAAPAAAEATEAKDSFTVELTSVENKIPVMKVVKEILGLGLKEAKDLVEAAPKVIKENVKKEEAEDLKKKIEAAGAKVTLK